MNRPDLIVAGAGLGGLSFLWHWLESENRSQRITVIDRTFEPRSDRTWCFWGPPTAMFSVTACHSWHNAEVRFSDFAARQNLGNLRYHCIQSEDYQRLVLARIRNHPNVTLIEASIQEIGEDDDGAFVVSSVGRHTASWVVQSVQGHTARGVTARYPIRQHFGGLEVETTRPVFTPDRFTMMDFRVPQRDGVTFMYTLPTSETTALVEHTVFSPTTMTPEEHFEATEQYIRGTLDTDFTVLRRESGDLPMDDTFPPQQSSPRVFNIGIVGGNIKPSTGYAFSRIQRHTRVLASSFALTGRLTPVAASPSRFALYDLLFLRVMHSKPAHALMVFEALFRKNPIENVMKFLDERTHLFEELRMFVGLPKRHLLGGVFALMGRLRWLRAIQPFRGLGIAASLFAGWLSVLWMGLHGLHPAAGTMAADGAWILLTAFLSSGVFMTAHEAMHGLVVPGFPQTNRWVGRLSTWTYAGLDYDTLERAHHLHHAHPATANDPDYHRGSPNPLRWYWNFMTQYLTWGQVIRMHVLFLALFYGLSIPLSNLMWFWAVPLLLSTLQLFFVGTWLPHRPGSYRGDGPLKARSLDLNPILSFFACFHFGYHYEHHARPDLPWWRLWRVRGLDGDALHHAYRPRLRAIPTPSSLKTIPVTERVQAS